MKALSRDEFAKRVMALADSAKSFEPIATYDPDGDCIEVLFRADDFYAERVDGLVTVYYSRKTNKIVGSLIKGVRSLCAKIQQNCPGFAIQIKEGPVQIQYLFLAHVWTEPPKEPLLVQVYEKLIEAAKETNVTTELVLT